MSRTDNFTKVFQVMPVAVRYLRKASMDQQFMQEKPGVIADLPSHLNIIGIFPANLTPLARELANNDQKQ